MALKKLSADPRTDPWNVPVPVRPGDFLTLRREHAELALQTDLGAIDSFGAPPGVAADDLLYADLQVGAGENVLRRLGSGRSGFFRGKYLKGIGRTTLAANWNDERDTYHSTGHMFASSAIREFVATCYMRAKGLEEAIVPCEGLLVRPLDRKLRDGLARFEAGLSWRLPEVDRRLQAITVKDGRFARFSNLGWLSSFMGPSAHSAARFAYLLESYSGRPGSGALDARACTPESCATALARAVDRGLNNHLAFFSAGIDWGSYYNNFTLDGRFLDLEVPVFLGAPLVGRIVQHSGRWPDRSQLAEPFTPFGCQVFYYLGQVRCSIEDFVGRLRSLRARNQEPHAGAFLESLADELERALGPAQIASRGDALREQVSNLLIDIGASPRIRDAVAAVYERWVEHADRAPLEARFRRCPGRASRPEPTAFATAREAIDWLDRRPRSVPDPEAEFMNAWLERLDSCGDPELLLEGLQELETELPRAIRPLPASRASSAPQLPGRVS